MSETISLAGKTVLVSGATGQVGRELLSALVTHGAKVAAAVRRPWQVALVEEMLEGADSLVGVVEPQDSEAAAGLVKGVLDSLGPIEAFVSVAGAFGMAEVGADQAGDASRLMEANYLSVVNLVRAVIGPMRKRGSGRLVLTGAAAVGSEVPGLSLYLASKAALHQFARCLEREVAGQGLQVIVVTPDTIDTESNRKAMPGEEHGAWLPVEQMVRAILCAANGSLSDGPLFDPRKAR